MTVRLFDPGALEDDVDGALAVLRALPAPARGGIALAPLPFAAANRTLQALHRHSTPVVGMKFGIRAHIAGEPVGIAVAGRPVARVLDDGLTLEVLRVCTWTDARNVCSRLYGACCRAAWALGYRRVVTYTTNRETAASVRASGFREDGRRRAESWDTPARARAGDHHGLSDRVRWLREVGA